jgi:hypothetical protein
MKRATPEPPPGDRASAARVEGYVAPGFEPVREAFGANFLRYGEVGAQCCVYLGGQVVVALLTPSSRKRIVARST